MTQCAKRCPNPPLPAGLTLEVARTHPRYAHLLVPGVQCEHDTGHAGPHRAPGGGLIWHDPPKLIVGGETA